MFKPYFMYERFIFCIDHAALHWLLTLDDPSGQPIRLRIRLAEFYIKVNYKKFCANTQANALSTLNSRSETILIMTMTTFQYI